MIFAALVALLVGGFSTAYIASGEVRYLWRAGYEETRILQSRQPIEKLARDTTLPAAERGQLQLVLRCPGLRRQARVRGGRYLHQLRRCGPRYAAPGAVRVAEDVHLSPHLEVSHRRQGALQGILQPRPGPRHRGRVRREGLRHLPAAGGAFSTLGWFEDPLLSTALTRDSVELAALVFHEIAHNSLYVKSATEFNESFAQLAGYRAAEQFFRDRGDSANAASAANRWLDEIVLGNFYTELVGRLTTFYATKPDSAALDSGRVAIGLWAREQLEGPVSEQLRTHEGREAPWRPGEQRTPGRGAHLPDQAAVVRGLVRAARGQHRREREGAPGTRSRAPKARKRMSDWSRPSRHSLSRPCLTSSRLHVFAPPARSA